MFEGPWKKYKERGRMSYSALLFPDDLTGSRRVNELLFNVAQQSPELQTKLLEKFSYYPQSWTEGKPPDIIAVSDVYSKTGGKKEFFADGSVVLDMASGVGRAVSQFKNRRNTIVGMDITYESQKPENRRRGLYVAANWKALPFADDTFTAVMSCEGFPRHGNPTNDANVIEDTTRICREGAVWRATMLKPFNFLFDDGIDSVELARRQEMVKSLTGNGWGVLIRPGLFIAKLVDKKPSQKN